MNRSLANVIFGGYGISASKAQAVRLPAPCLTAHALAGPTRDSCDRAPCGAAACSALMRTWHGQLPV